MSGLGMAMDTAKNALNAQQFGLNVTGQNIANVNNPSYSKQSLVLSAKNPLPTAGNILLGDGVKIDSIKRNCNKFLETQLFNQQAYFSGYEEISSYMDIMEGYFNENSDNCISALMTDFWNSWQELENNPSGATERNNVFQTSSVLVGMFNSLDTELTNIENVIAKEVDGAVTDINSLTKQIADLNTTIVAHEASSPANELKDNRSSLVTRLSEYVGIKDFEQSNGTYSIIIANGYPLVSGSSNYELAAEDGKVLYKKSSSSSDDISSNITDGKLGGWITMKDEISAKYHTELNALAKQFIWALNQQHSQGVGENYFSSSITGTYETDKSGLLSTLTYGDKIDYTKDFKMWVEDTSSATATYSSIAVDMGISTATVSNWVGNAPKKEEYKYVFDVMSGGTVASDGQLTISDGVGLSTVQTGADVTTALNTAIAEQTITVSGGTDKTQTVTIKDTGGDAIRSASSIAAALTKLNGVTAYAEENKATIDINALLNSATANPNDTASFTLKTVSSSATVEFKIGADDSATRTNFLTALTSAVSTINDSAKNLVIDSSKLTSDDYVRIISEIGDNIGIENFQLADQVVTTIDTFTNFNNVATSATISAFDPALYSNGNSIEFTVDTATGAPVTITYPITDATSATTLADGLNTVLTAAPMVASLAAIGVTAARGLAPPAGQGTDTFKFDATAAAQYLDFKATATRSPVFPVTTISNFEDFAGLTTAAFTMTRTIAPAATNNITVTLPADTTDQAAMAQAFVDAINATIPLPPVPAPQVNIATRSGNNVIITPRIRTDAEYTFTIGTGDSAASSAKFAVAVSDGLLDNSSTTADFKFDNSDVLTCIAPKNVSFDINPTDPATTKEYGKLGSTSLDFDGTSDLEQFVGINNATFTITPTGPGAGAAVIITADLSRIDVTSQAELATAFFNALDTKIADAEVANLGTSITITSTAKSSSSYTFTAGAESGDDATIDVAVVGGTLDQATFRFGNSDELICTADTTNEAIDFDGTTLTEGGATDSGVKAGLLTVNLDPDYSIQSSVAGTATAGGLFNVAAGTAPTLYNEILTLGGEGGFSGFDANDTISFKIDDTKISYTVVTGDDTDVEFATKIKAELDTAFSSNTNYSIIRNGAVVSILKKDGKTIELTDFAESTGGTPNATLVVEANTNLSTANTSATSRKLDPNGILSWEKYDSDGLSQATGEIIIGNAGKFDVDESITFDIGAGTLVAGNTFTVNTDTNGVPNPLTMTPSKKANSINDTYIFEITTGGKVGTDTITGTWKNTLKSETFTIKGTTPIYVDVDGMQLKFDTGSLAKSDVFTITTDKNGTPTAQLPSTYHWTMKSFRDQFNRQAVGMKATVTTDYNLNFAASTTGYELKNFSYENESGSSAGDGFSDENITVKVDNYSLLNKAWTDMNIVRNDLLYQTTGNWTVDTANNPGYVVTLTAKDGFNLDNGFYVEFDGKRVADVAFTKEISENGTIEFDIALANGNYNYAFSDNNAKDSGLTAALGINTFFDGKNALTIKTNSIIEENDNIAAAQIDSTTGMFAIGSNANVVNIAKLQHTSYDIAQWEYKRDSDATSINLNATLESYYTVMIGSIGIETQSVLRNKAYGEVMIENISQQKDSISAVSLDEEMINMMKFQHAYSAAAKLISTVDNMWLTLLGIVK